MSGHDIESKKNCAERADDKEMSEKYVRRSMFGEVRQTLPILNRSVCYLGAPGRCRGLFKQCEMTNNTNMDETNIRPYVVLDFR